MSSNLTSQTTGRGFESLLSDEERNHLMPLFKGETEGSFFGGIAGAIGGTTAGAVLHPLLAPVGTITGTIDGIIGGLILANYPRPSIPDDPL